MKILIVHNAYQSHQIGGEDIVVRQEIAALKEALGEENVFDYGVSNDEIRRLRLIWTLWGNKQHQKVVNELVRQHDIQLVHVHNFFPLLSPSVFKGAALAGAKVIHTLHNFRWWCLSGDFYRQKTGICEQCIHKKIALPGIYHGCYRRSRIQSVAAALAFGWYRFTRVEKYIDAYFVLTPFQKEKLKAHLPPPKVFLKPNAIEPQKKSDPAYKKNYLFVGRLEPAKGIEWLLAQWARLPAYFELDIIGKGESVFEKRLKDKYTQKNIRFLGGLPLGLVREHMARAKYLLHPSFTYETFGLTLMEAFSCGTPVIALDRGPRSEWIVPLKNGFLFQPDTWEAIMWQAQNFSAYEMLCQGAFESAKPFYGSLVLSTQLALYRQILGEVG